MIVGFEVTMWTKLSEMQKQEWIKSQPWNKADAPLQDKYAMTVKYNDVTVGRVPNFYQK